ncbi:MAG: NADH-quinone oxidoreductase subunit C [Calditrichaeota bacterium]|nr:NADH-quinone oxidoreductase subunit C [Calditrichota bacterium]
MTVQEFVKQLKEKSGAPFDAQIHSARRVYVRVARENLKWFAQLLFQEMKAKFSIATGIHIREGFEVLYHFTFNKDGFICTLRTLAPHDDPTLDSLVSVIPGTMWIEREIYDILGVRFKGHPKLKRLVKAEFFKENEFPFRKDFDIKKYKENHGLLPKVSYFTPDSEKPPLNKPETQTKKTAD